LHDRSAAALRHHTPPEFRANWIWLFPQPRYMRLYRKTERSSAMWRDPLFVVVAVAVCVVVVILAIGIGGFAKGGDFNRKHANRLMRYRIAAQAVAVVLILIFVAVRQLGGN